MTPKRLTSSPFSNRSLILMFDIGLVHPDTKFSAFGHEKRFAFVLIPKIYPVHTPTATINTYCLPPFYGRLSRNQPKFESQCADRCICDHEVFSPICGADGITYFSACHAGCRNRTFGKEYTAGYKVYI